MQSKYLVSVHACPVETHTRQEFKTVRAESVRDAAIAGVERAAASGFKLPAPGVLTVYVAPKTAPMHVSGCPMTIHALTIGFGERV